MSRRSHRLAHSQPTITPGPEQCGRHEASRRSIRHLAREGRAPSKDRFRLNDCNAPRDHVRYSTGAVPPRQPGVESARTGRTGTPRSIADQCPGALVHAPGSPWWISDNGSGWSTLYNSTGVAHSLKVVVPGAKNDHVKSFHGPGYSGGVDGIRYPGP